MNQTTVIVCSNEIIYCFLGGRFDRFKSNEKKENGEIIAEEAVKETEKAVKDDVPAEALKTEAV